LSFSELVQLPLKTRPRALLSTSMALLPGLRRQLEARFDCPVLDLYSMNEAGPVAVADSRAGGHVLLQHELYLEILDPQGRPLPEGERGEVTLTGGFNFCLPLLRYRTGDYASLRLDLEEPVLVDLAGRPPVTFHTAQGERLNNIEVTHALQIFAIPQYTLHQRADKTLQLRLVKNSAPLPQVRLKLETVFGPGLSLEIEEVDTFEGKVIQYTSDVNDSRS
jgi:phenylacetate-CoA ligase